MADKLQQAIRCLWMLNDDANRAQMYSVCMFHIGCFVLFMAFMNDTNAPAAEWPIYSKAFYYLSLRTFIAIFTYLSTCIDCKCLTVIANLSMFFAAFITFTFAALITCKFMFSLALIIGTELLLYYCIKSYLPHLLPLQVTTTNGANTDVDKQMIASLQDEVVNAQRAKHEIEEKYVALQREHETMRSEMKTRETEYKAWEQRYSEMELQYVERVKQSDFEKWTTTDVIQWMLSLDKLRYSKYGNALLVNMSKEKIDGHCLKELSKDDLHRLGVYEFADKNEIYRAIQALTATPAEGENESGLYVR